jgi:hypothetical protein
MTEALSVGQNFSMSAADRATFDRAGKSLAHNNVDVDVHVLSELSARSSREIVCVDVDSKT